MQAAFVLLIWILIKYSYSELDNSQKDHICDISTKCRHNWTIVCGREPKKAPSSWFRDSCTMLEYNCQHNRMHCVEEVYASDIQHGHSRMYLQECEVGTSGSFETESSEESNMANIKSISVILIIFYLSLVASHGPPADRDTEDINMGRKVKKTSAKWCNMAKVCNHDRVPVCGLSHAGDIMGFRDLCDMFDFNCIRRRNYKQTNCPADKNFLTASRKPTNPYYDD